MNISLQGYERSQKWGISTSHSSTLKKLDQMGKEFDKPVLEWKEKIESHASLCNLLSKCEEYVKENEVIKQEFVPEGFQTINVSPLNLSFPFTKMDPYLSQTDLEASNECSDNSICTDSECELFDVDNLLIEEDSLYDTFQSSLNSVTSSGEPLQNFEEWLDENAPGFSKLSFDKLENIAQEIGKDGVDALDSSDVSNLRRKLELDTPPMYQIIGDNIDLYIKTKHMSSEKQNKSIHWFAMNAVQDRITGSGLQNERSIKPIMEMENKEFLPSTHDNEDLLHDFIPLFARVIVEKIPAMRTFKSVIVRHIPHKYSNEMKKKSTQVPHICKVDHI